MLFYRILVLFAVLKIADAVAFKNCNDSIPIQMFFEFPDPLTVTLGKPVSLTAGAVLKQELPMKMKVKHQLARRFLGRWITIPCVNFHQFGSCTEDITCDGFIKMGYNGTCPIKKGVYKDYKVSMPTPKIYVPWFFNGLYKIHIEGYTEDFKELIFCGDMVQYIEQAWANKKSKTAKPQ